jgi:hypothetical protein
MSDVLFIFALDKPDLFLVLVAAPGRGQRRLPWPKMPIHAMGQTWFLTIDLNVLGLPATQKPVPGPWSIFGGFSCVPPRLGTD